MRLSERYHEMTAEEREALARAADTDAGYLWQLATRWRGKRASLGMMQKLAEADAKLTVADMAAEFTEDPPKAAPSALSGVEG